MNNKISYLIYKLNAIVVECSKYKNIIVDYVSMYSNTICTTSFFYYEAPNNLRMGTHNPKFKITMCGKGSHLASNRVKRLTWSCLPM